MNPEDRGVCTAQFRLRQVLFKAGLILFPDNFDSFPPRISKSSINFRNMTQVSSGRRPNSPFNPLSLRTMSLADLSKESGD